MVLPWLKILLKNNEFDVTVADVNTNALELLKSKGIKTIEKSLDDPQIIKRLVTDYDIVLNALPGFMGYKSVEAVIETGKM